MATAAAAARTAAWFCNAPVTRYALPSWHHRRSECVCVCMWWCNGVLHLTLYNTNSHLHLTQSDEETIPKAERADLGINLTCAPVLPRHGLCCPFVHGIVAPRTFVSYRSTYTVQRTHYAHKAFSAVAPHRFSTPFQPTPNSAPPKTRPHDSRCT